MGFFERLFPKSKKEQPIKSTPEEQKNLVLSEIKEEGKKIYFEVSQEISIEKAEQIFNEITENLDIAPMIRQGFGIEADADKKVARVIINTENFSHIEGFTEEAKRILEEIKNKLKSNI